VLSLSAHADALLVDRIAAVVDTHAITRSAVEARTRQVMRSNPDADRTKAFDQTLATMIEERLIQKDAVRLQVTVTDEDVENALLEVGKQNQLTGEALLEEVKRQGMTADTYRALLGEQLLEMKWLMRKMNRAAMPTEGDHAAYLAAERERLLTQLKQEFFIEVRR
jgi:peptidyl-prolyl cis-trans isomerase SurA